MLRTAVGRTSAASSFLNVRKGLGAVQEHPADIVDEYMAEEGQTGGAAGVERTRSISGKGGADAAALAEQLRARELAESEEARGAEGAS